MASPPPSKRGDAEEDALLQMALVATVRDAPQTAQEGAAGAAAPQPGHMAPCACHCAACRAAGHNGTACVFLCAGLHDLFDGRHHGFDLAVPRRVRLGHGAL